MAHIIKPPKKFSLDKYSVFLAGSIEMGKAEDWQSKIEKALANKDVIVLNPRRDDWDSSWKQDIHNEKFKEQVTWELKGQEDADCIVIYFDPKSTSPISLLELGLFGDKNRTIVCCPKGFFRKGNVDIVCERYGIPLVETLEDLITSLIKRIDSNGALSMNESIVSQIKNGDLVTIVTKQKQLKRGKARIFNRATETWVLNMGGSNGIPAIASDDNIVAINGKSVRSLTENALGECEHCGTPGQMSFVGYHSNGREAKLCRRCNNANVKGRLKITDTKPNVRESSEIQKDVILDKGDVIKKNGIPVELKQATTASTNMNNVKMLKLKELLRKKIIGMREKKKSNFGSVKPLEEAQGAYSFDNVKRDKKGFYNNIEMMGHRWAKENADAIERICNKYGQTQFQKYIIYNAFDFNREGDDWHYFTSMSKKYLSQVQYILKNSSNQTPFQLLMWLEHHSGLLKTELNWALEWAAYKRNKAEYKRAYVREFGFMGLRPEEAEKRMEKYIDKIVKKDVVNPDWV